MADLNTTSTSSGSLEKCICQQPNGQDESTTNLSENYINVKTKQQKYSEISAKLNEKENKKIDTQNDNADADDISDHIERKIKCEVSAKLPQNIAKLLQNKLKRKKKLSVSLTSVTDIVNQEKRTCIEGIHLNCRGKFNSHSNKKMMRKESSCTNSFTSPTPHHCGADGILKMEKVLTKPPIPPSKAERAQNGTAIKVPPPRLKRKLEENVYTIQKLNALTDQMRLEISELRQNLQSEKGAVRVLR